jgi:AcrR family transcriptional regulator
VSERASYHHGDLRRVVLDASLLLIETEGVEALSMREVARRANVSHGAPYHHFPDRGAIVAALAEEGFVRLEAELRAAVARASDATTRFEAAGRAYILFAGRHGAQFRIMFRPEMVRREEYPAIDVVAAAACRVLAECIAECQREGVAPGGDPGPLVLTSWATAHGVAALWLDGPLSRGGGRKSLRELADSVAKTFSGLLAAGGRARTKRAR